MLEQKLPLPQLGQELEPSSLLHPYLISGSAHAILLSAELERVQ